MELGLLSQKLEQIGLVDEFCPIHDEQLFRIPSGENICEVCEKDKLLKEIAEQQKVRDAENLKEKIRNAHNSLALSPRLQKYTFNTFAGGNKKQSEAKTICYSFANSYPKVGGGLVLIGGIGTGKTHLAVAICQTLCDRGVSCRIMTVSQIIRKIKETWRNDATDEWGNRVSEQDVINGFSDIDLLVIDEIGAQFGSDSERIFITEIINNRYEQERPTILIGNVKLSELENLIGARAVDRVLHGGSLLIFDWESQRGRK